MPRPSCAGSLTGSVRQHMTAINLAAILGAAAICGCAQHHISSSQQAGGIGPSAPAREPATDPAAAMLGTWESHDDEILLKLGPDECWKWWDLSQQRGRPPEPPTL